MNGAAGGADAPELYLYVFQEPVLETTMSVRAGGLELLEEVWVYFGIDDMPALDARKVRVSLNSGVEMHQTVWPGEPRNEADICELTEVLVKRRRPELVSALTHDTKNTVGRRMIRPLSEKGENEQPGLGRSEASLAEFRRKVFKFA